MKLSELLQGLECEIVQKGFECEITSLTSDSRKITENGVFICITGAVSDGHKYIPQVIQKKAGVIVIQDSALGNDETASLKRDSFRYNNCQSTEYKTCTCSYVGKLFW